MHRLFAKWSQITTSSLGEISLFGLRVLQKEQMYASHATAQGHSNFLKPKGQEKISVDW